MNFAGILSATLIVGGVGLLIGLLLGAAGRKFAVEVDEKEVAVRETLPGNNCGGCGYPGCDGLAAAIAKGEAEANACPVGGVPVAEQIGAIMGVEVTAVRQYAHVRCAGDCNATTARYHYSGSQSCRETVYVTGSGSKSCSYGCRGYGDCMAVCDFDAISIVDGIAKVDRFKCAGCGKCVRICPKHIIELVPETAQCIVSCVSKDAGRNMRNTCKAGCIGCGICVKNCPAGAITVTDNVASIDYGKCTGCGICKEKCPKKIIQSI